MDNGKDYCVEVQASFLLDPDGSDRAFAEARQAFSQHVEQVFAGNEDLWNNTIGDIDVHADGQRMHVRYLFASHGESKMEAESFSANCLRKVQKKIEAFGCRLEKLECAAEEVVQWEEPQPKEDMAPVSKKKRAGQER